MLSGIHTFMKPYLFIDIITHFIFQIPLNIYIRNESTLDTYFKILGYVKIVEDFLGFNSFIYIFLKIICYFLLLIQENTYQ